MDIKQLPACPATSVRLARMVPEAVIAKVKQANRCQCTVQAHVAGATPPTEALHTDEARLEPIKQYKS